MGAKMNKDIIKNCQNDKLLEANYAIHKNWNINLEESRLKIAKSMILKHKGNLLDISCSKGEFSSCFLNKDINVYGLDFDIERLKEASKIGIKVITADISCNLPFKDGKFDIIFAGEILEHLIDTDAFVSEAKRVLKNTGKLIITTPNLTSLENRLRILFGKYPIWVDYNTRSSGHVRCYTPRVLKHQLTIHGFKIIKHTGNWVPFIPQRYIDDIKFPPLTITGKLFPNLAMDIIIEAEKI